MAEYIDREAAMAYAPLPKELRKYQTFNLDDAWEDGYDFAISQISAIPAADVRPVVRGKWMLCLKGEVACTNCGSRSKRKTKFCPNCGADMREES